MENKATSNLTLRNSRSSLYIHTSSVSALHPSTLLSPLNPWFVTGFCDGESALIVSIQKKAKLRVGWEVRVCFNIGLHKRDKKLLGRLQSFFGSGALYEKKGGEALEYKVSSVTEIMDPSPLWYLSFNN